jgi:hypothetical protein
MHGIGIVENEIYFAAFVGLDWAEQKRVFTLQSADSPQVEKSELEHPGSGGGLGYGTRATLRRTARRYRTGAGTGALVFMLTKYEHLVLFPVPPAALANYRKSFRFSGAKGDPQDAGLLLDLLIRHRDKLRQIHPDTPERRMLQF